MKHLLASVFTMLGASAAFADPAPDEGPAIASADIFVYAAHGQTEKQLDRDRYECHNWAVAQTHYNPSDPHLAPHQQIQVVAVADPPPPHDTVVGAMAGAMIGAAIGVLSPLLSLPLTTKGLIVTVIGGLGSIPGAIIAGLLVGGFENLFQYFRGVTERDLYVMLLLFAFLVFRPGGIFSPAAGRD